MDRTGEVAELLVEHATDFRMCDLLEDGGPPGGGGGGGPGCGGGGSGGIVINNLNNHRKSGDGISLGLVPGKLHVLDKFSFSISVFITYHEHTFRSFPLSQMLC